MKHFLRSAYVRLIACLAFGTSLSCSEQALAQACCAAGAAVSPGRLALHEIALVGIQLTPAWGLGSYDAAGDFHGKEPGARQLDLTLTPFFTVEIVNRLQFGVSVPFVMSVRKGRESDQELGGGIGDVATNARYDFIRDGEFRYVPGLALLASVTAPTGRTPEAAKNDLGSDATGLGVWQWSAGLWCERSFGSWLISGAALVSARSSRTVSDLKSQLAPQITGLVAVGYSFTESFGVAGFGSYSAEGKVRIDGEPTEGTAKRLLRLNLASSLNVRELWRFQAGVFLDPPIDKVAQNQLSSTGVLLSMMRTWM